MAPPTRSVPQPGCMVASSRFQAGLSGTTLYPDLMRSSRSAEATASVAFTYLGRIGMEEPSDLKTRPIRSVSSIFRRSMKEATVRLYFRPSFRAGVIVFVG